MKIARIAGAALTLSMSATAPAHTQSVQYLQVIPDQIKWAPLAALPGGGQVAVIYGEPRKTGLYATRVKLPADFKIPPHRHPDERLYTVISGTFYIGFGDRFDPDALAAYPAGSAFVVPANASHFHWMRSGESVVQISGIAPSGTEFVDHADAPPR